MAASAPVTTMARATPEEVRSVIATALDGDFYRAVNRDLQGHAVDVVRHYAESGWREGRDPAPWFSTRAYLAAFPEVTKAGWNPFHHYLVRGRYEGREVARSAWADEYLLRRARRGEEPAWSFAGLVGDGQAAEAVADEAQVRLAERRLAEPEFDAAFYLAANV
ncbi:MAG: hypothetical protein JSS35_16370, partial [Proteobacteria bacterium]|nr:hypothetical protein [Pseudomonadota bacterium]